MRKSRNSALDELVEQLHRARVGVRQLRQLLVAHLLVERAVDRAPVGKLRAVGDPLPELRARDLGGGGVLHQVEDRDRAVAVDPRREVLQRDADVVAHAVLGDGAARHARVWQLRRRHADLLAQPFLLVRLGGAELASKTSFAIGTRSGCATQVPSKPSLVSRSLSARDLRQRLLVDLRVLPRRDERRHAAHRVRPALVAGLDEELGVGAHERHRHRDLRAVGRTRSRRERNFLISENM